MRINEMGREIIHRFPPIKNIERKASHLPIPMKMEIHLPFQVRTWEELSQGVKDIKTTPWYRILKRRGMHFVPVDYHGPIIIAVGTTIALGTAYIGYKKIKETMKKRTK